MKESDDGEQPQRVYAAAAMVEDDAMDYIGGWDEDEGRFEDDWSDFEYDDDAAYEDDEFEGAFDYGLQNDDEDGYNADEGYEDYVDAYEEDDYEEDYAEYDDGEEAGEGHEQDQNSEATRESALSSVYWPLEIAFVCMVGVAQHRWEALKI